MNWIFIIIVLLILFFAVRGGFQGFLRILFSLVSIILLVVLVAFATPHINTLLRDHTSVYASLEKSCTQRVETYIDNKMSSTAKDSDENWNFPAPVQKYINDAIEEEGKSSGISAENKSEWGSRLQEAGEQARTQMAETIGGKIADVLLSVVSFLIALIVVLILLFIISHVLGLVNRIPVLGGINRVLGVFGGAFQGVILSWIILLLLSLLAGTKADSPVSVMISENAFVSWLYDHNGVLYVLQMFFRGNS